MRKSGGKAVRYNKWGYIFLIPFIVVYVVFQLVPLITTIYNSFFENYMSGLTQIGPNFVGFENYEKLFTSGDIWQYFKNTMVLWIMCFIPQIFLSLKTRDRYCCDTNTPSASSLALISSM